MNSQRIKVRIQKGEYSLRVRNRNEALRNLCNKAIAKHLRDLNPDMSQAEAIAMIELNDVQAVSLKQSRIALDMSLNVENSGLEYGEILELEISPDSVENLEIQFPRTNTQGSSGSNLSTVSGYSGQIVNSISSTKSGMSSHNKSTSGGSERHSQKLEFTEFPSRDIWDATNNFSESNYLGGDDHARVYKAVLNGSEVTVKRFLKKNDFDISKQTHIFREVEHHNLLKIHGYCADINCLVSEYLNGGSLKDRLRDTKEERYPQMGWSDRVKICADMASAVSYLQSKEIVHTELQLSNIKFSEFGVPKVSDLGTPKSFAESLRVEINRMSLGIFKEKSNPGSGVLDSSCAGGSNLSEKFDVYAMGIIILQLAVNEPDLCGLEKIIGGKRGSTTGVIDLLKPFLLPYDNSLSWEKLLDFVRLGLECVQANAELRPTLEDIQDRLSKEAPVSVPHNGTDVEQIENTIKTNSNLTEVENAVQWLFELAAEGSSDAQLLLAECYQNGCHKIEKDWEFAYRWLKIALKNNHKDAHKKLEEFCRLLFESIPVFSSKLTDSQRTAMYLLTRAATELKLARAQYLLGICYFFGYGLPRDRNKGMTLYSMAAKQGYVVAQYNLARCYENGNASIRDKDLAEMWYKAAMANGSLMAEVRLNILSKKSLKAKEK